MTQEIQVAILFLLVGSCLGYSFGILTRNGVDGRKLLRAYSRGKADGISEVILSRRSPIDEDYKG
jgi:hypothetical protein